MEEVERGWREVESEVKRVWREVKNVEGRGGERGEFDKK